MGGDAPRHEDAPGHIGSRPENDLVAWMARLASAAPAEIDAQVVETLGHLCRELGTDRALIWQSSPERPSTFRTTHDWALGQRPPRPTGSDALPWITRRLQQGQVVAVPDVASLPPEASADRASMVRAGDRAALAIPFGMREGGVPGAILLTTSSGHEGWTSRRVELGRLVAQVVDGVLTRMRADEALKESEALFRTLFENASSAMAVIEADTTISMVNEWYCRLLGCRREDVVGMSWTRQVVPEDLPRLREYNRLRIADPASAPDRYQFRYFHASGEVRTADIAVAWIPSRKKIVASFSDVTAKQKAEEQLRQSQKMEAVGRLAGGVAHDFNNLLTVMLTASRFALDEAPPGSPLREDIEEIRRAAERARMLTQQLLAFSRRQVLRPRHVDLNEEILDAERLLTRLIGEHVRLRTELGCPRATVTADPAQLHQVIMNLAINGQDAMPGGGILTIRTSSREALPPDAISSGASGAGPWVVLEVEDTGSGMDEHTRSHVFEPFFTTKPVGSGTGLGLSMVFGVVQQSGGAIRVDSAPGRGTRFEIFLPRSLHGPDEVPAPVAEAASAPPGTTVLVVEDQADVRRATERMLRRSGFDVITAGSLPEAMDALGRHPRQPAILLTDVRMPGHSGSEVAAVLAARLPGLRTIYMSGYSGEEMESAGGLPEGSLFLQKPFLPAEFVRKVREALGS